MIVNYGSLGIREEVAYFKTLLLHSPERTEENNKNS